MEYFILSQSNKLENPIEIKAIDVSKYKLHMTKETFDTLDRAVVGYFKNEEDIEIPDILLYPTYLLSDGIKELFSLYDESIEWKAMQVFSAIKDDRTAPLYWIPLFSEVDCVHSDTEFYNNGMLKRLVLDKEKLMHLEKDIFCAKGLIGTTVIISLAVAESLLRRKFYGIGLERIEVK